MGGYYDFAVDERETLGNYLKLENGIPSHDTMQRVFGIMCGVQEELFDFRFGEELLHGEPVIKETDGVMPRSRTEEREYGQVIF